LPRHCGACDTRLTVAGHFCTRCVAALPWNTPACPGCALPTSADTRCAACLAHPRPFDSAFAAFTLDAPVRQAIHALKYQAVFRHAPALAHLMAETVRQRAEPMPEWLLPVPLHRGRLWRRGYNQSLELTRVLSQALDIPLLADALRKPRATPDQIGLGIAARRRALAGAFTADSRLAGRHIALVDDVMTTGATFEALTLVAKKAGAASVQVWALARTPKRDD
jgi:ComF family protein